MAVDKQVYVAIAPWTAPTVAGALENAFIGSGLMTGWYDSFVSGGREHRVLEVIYDGAKTYGKTYYWFTIDGVGIRVQVASGWNVTSHIPAGAGGSAGIQYVDWYSTDTTVNNGYLLLTISNSISFSVTRYTSGTRSIFTLRSSYTYQTFTIDSASTTFRPFYNLNYGYHSGVWSIACQSRTVRFNQLIRTRRELFLGSSQNNSGYAGGSICFNILSIPQNYGNYYSPTVPNEGFVLPGWTTAANPSAPSDLNPVFTGIRPNSVITTDLPVDFGVTSIKTSNLLNIQDNATVTPGVEEYEILAFENAGIVNNITSNPAFLARII